MLHPRELSSVAVSGWLAAEAVPRSGGVAPDLDGLRRVPVLAEGLLAVVRPGRTGEGRVAACA